ncbi:hypothetical protein DC522_28440 [Microvirga sp. KLBC 81]|uniref:hypothetical protein n=1 Tax=Microvirga sp. KLBC 81 TaxID=1862707 RepID=UPI000D50CE24|nr:hypothetical protein [Microvirga sp. KLBC 81]PVE21114.1 hypothetical protein DC522_28440 [Microvirga sp. KLBC 81]
MVKTWHSAPGGTYICPSCGAVYEVTLQRFSARDKDYACCECCDNVMAEWNDTEVPSFKLVEAPKMQGED